MKAEDVAEGEVCRMRKKLAWEIDRSGRKTEKKKKKNGL